MSAPKNIFKDETQTDKFARKAKEQPMFPIGLAGLTLVCLYGAYKYKSRGSMSTSIFLIQLRVAAQGTVVACLTAGIAYNMYRTYFLKDTKDNDK